MVLIFLMSTILASPSLDAPVSGRTRRTTHATVLLQPSVCETFTITLM